MQETTKTKLPAVLAEYYCEDYLQDIPRDIRKSDTIALARIFASPEKFPNANWDALHARHEAMLLLAMEW